jgi:hypothetical protein
MITETLQPINCFISTKNEILHERTAPVLGRRVSARARASRTTSVNGIGLRSRLAEAEGGADASSLSAGADESPGAATSMT